MFLAFQIAPVAPPSHPIQYLPVGVQPRDNKKVREIWRERENEEGKLGSAFYLPEWVRSLAACINIVSNVVFRRVAACRHKRADLSLPFSSLPVHTSLLKRKSYNKVFLIITPSSRMRPVSGARSVCGCVSMCFWHSLATGRSITWRVNCRPSLHRNTPDTFVRKQLSIRKPNLSAGSSLI